LSIQNLAETALKDTHLLATLDNSPDNF
jgi:hypothetical protein